MKPLLNEEGAFDFGCTQAAADTPHPRQSNLYAAGRSTRASQAARACASATPPTSRALRGASPSILRASRGVGGVGGRGPDGARGMARAARAGACSVVEAGRRAAEGGGWADPATGGRGVEWAHTAFRERVQTMVQTQSATFYKFKREGRIFQSYL